jgi:hypothetical protein
MAEILCGCGVTGFYYREKIPERKDVTLPNATCYKDGKILKLQ